MGGLDRQVAVAGPLGVFADSSRLVADLAAQIFSDWCYPPKLKPEVGLRRFDALDPRTLRHCGHRLRQRLGFELAVALGCKLSSPSRYKLGLAAARSARNLGSACNLATVAAPIVRPSITSLSQCTLQNNPTLAEREVASENGLLWCSLT
jgi:hypothetical protein